MSDDQPMIPDDYANIVAMMVDTNSGTVIDGRPPRKLFVPRERDRDHDRVTRR